MIFQKETIYFTSVLINLWPLGAKTFEIIFISYYQAHGLLLQILSMNGFYTFPNTFCTVHMILNIKPQTEKIILHLYKTIQ